MPCMGILKLKIDMMKLEQYINEIPNPCYVIEEDLLRRNLSLISHVAESAGVEVILAFKAFALWKSFSIFREYITHTTASSLYEARLSKEEFGTYAHTYSPAYIDEEFYAIMDCSGHVTFNSLNQYERFACQTVEYERNTGRHISCGLRVNPEYSEIETVLYNPCAPGSRFGVLASDLPDILPKELEGFHIHCHCESGADVFERTLAHIEEKFAFWFPQIKWINFGGGHLMTRDDYDVERLVSVLSDFRKRYPWLKVVLEPGSAFGWQTGPLVSKVVDIVDNSGVRTAILNVSFTCHMPDCLEMPYKPQVRYAETLEAEDIDTARSSRCIYRLGGNSCLSGDFMGLWRFEKELTVGDVVIFEDMIHYTTVKTCMFNGIGHPSIGMLHRDGKFELYRKFEYEDYRDRMC